MYVYIYAIEIITLIDWNIRIWIPKCTRSWRGRNHWVKSVQQHDRYTSVKIRHEPSLIKQTWYQDFYLSICLSIFLSICLSAYITICLSIYLSIYQYVYLCLLSSIYLSMYPVYLSVFVSCLSIYKYLSISVCVSCLSIYKFMNLYIYHLSIFELD